MKLPPIPKKWYEDVRRLPLLRVEWRDATSLPGWHSWSEIAKLEEDRLVECTSVGWLLPRKSKHAIYIGQTITTGGNCGEILIIPKGWIRGVKKIK